MVSEIYTTYDYSFYSNYDNKSRRNPTSYNDVSYQRMQENVFQNTNTNTNTNQCINMGNINRDKNGEAYYEFSYSPMLPKTIQHQISPEKTETITSSLVYYLKKWFCCGE